MEKVWVPPLPVELHHDEAVAGLLIRYCETNGWVSLRQFASGIGVTVGNCRGQAGDLRYLESRLGIEPGTLPSRLSRLGIRPTSKIGGHSLPHRLFRKKQRAVCRSCLIETGYMRGWWDIQPLRTCPTHGEALSVHCECGAPYTWNDSRQGRCERCVDNGVYHVSRGEKATPSPVELWLLLKFGVLAIGPELTATGEMTIPESLDLFEAIGELKRRGFSYMREEFEQKLASQSTESGFEVVQEGELRPLVEMVVRQYQALLATRVPPRPWEALGWFGMFLRDRFSSLSPGIRGAILGGLSDGLGYKIDGLELRSHLPIDEAAVHLQTAPGEMLNLLKDEGKLSECINDGELWLVPMATVRSLRRRFGIW